MRRCVLLLLGVLATAATAQVLPTTINDLSASDVAKLQSELLAWQASGAGLDAVKMGVATRAAPAMISISTTLRAPASVTADQLQRFLSAKQTVERLQQRHPRTSFSLQTPFALLTPDEFAAFVNRSNVHAHRELLGQQSHGHLRKSRELQQQQQQGQQPTTRVPPYEVDWQRAGCVSHVKNQGACGVCWIFSAIGALEGGYCAASSPTRALPVLSEQDVLSCGPSKGVCSPGNTYSVYDWLARLNGAAACTEASVPYDSFGSTSPECTRYDDANAKCEQVDLGLVGHVANQFENHHELEAAVAVQPVAVQLRAGVSYFQYYSGGVLMGDEELCPGTFADHELTIVGYGERNDARYWKVKNSWGEFWGEKGFAYIERGYQGARFGACGMENWGYYPVFRSQAPWMDARRCGSFRNGVQIVGQTIRNVTVKDASAGHCCDACRREPGCKAVSWGNTGAVDVCTLKSTIDGEVVDTFSGFTSAVVLTKSEAAGYRCMPLENNVDYPGNDYARTLTATAGECCDVCIQDPNCGAYTWTRWRGGSCFLKYAKAATKVNAPQPDGSPYFQSGEIYRCQPLQANVDFPGEDLMNAAATTPRECCALCRRNWPCLAFSWSDYQGGTCWLKRRAAPAIAKPGVVSATVY